MTDESLSQWQIEQSNLQDIKEKQRDKDFDDIIKMVEKMTPEEQKAFVEKMKEKDPVFRWLYDELKTYFDSQLSKLERQEEQRQTQKPKQSKKQNEVKKSQLQENKETKEIPTQKLSWETELEHIEKDKDFSKYKHLFEEKELNWNKVAVLKPDVLKAYLRQEKNKEPLAKLIWFEGELQKVKKQYDESIKASSNMPYAPQNMDASKEFALKQYEENKQKIIENTSDNFISLLKNTDIWKTILQNSLVVFQNEKLVSSINVNIWNKENAESSLTDSIANKTNILIWKLATLQNALNKEVSDFKNWWQENLKQRDYITWEKILYRDIPEKYEKLMKQEIRNYAFDIWKDIIKNNSPIVWEKKVFSLPIWDNNDVVLDFSSLWNTKNKSSEEILKLYEKNFDSIYKDSLMSKIWREMTSKKWLIDISWTVIWGAAAVKVSAWTWGAWIPVATLVFTAVESSYRAWMYELFDIEWGWQAGVWIDLENESTKDILKKKGIEMVSTATLFSLFRFTGWSQEKILHYINNPSITQSITWKISNYWIKTWIEWAFFTYFTIMMNNLQETAKNGWNTKEYLDSFTNIWNMDDLMKLFAFNLWFITAVKWWAKIAETSMILWYEKQLQTLTRELNEKWYTIINGRFYKWNNEVPVLLNPDFKRFADLNRKIAYIWWDSYMKPENGRWWKNYNTNLVDPSKRYERLERYSSETQSWKISYALNDKTIWETIQSNWLNAWKWVWEWLLKKSWFSNDEISQFRQWKLKWEKPVEVKAIWEMEKAMEVVYREYKKIEKAYLEWQLAKETSGYSKDITNKIMLLIQKETQSYKKEDI